VLIDGRQERHDGAGSSTFQGSAPSSSSVVVVGAISGRTLLC
jgi:hypothetical protein